MRLDRLKILKSSPIIDNGVISYLNPFILTNYY